LTRKAKLAKLILLDPAKSYKLICKANSTMADLVSIAEAKEHSSYTHEYITALVRKGKIKGRKSGNVWLVELESLQAYEVEMAELGSHS
jgi:hypothetical protein